ncbi:MAG: hypothetical protein KF726_05205 [Anaerolineae bacterium]|nr:hypothetical protein [Anaerolineae bacterium]
MRRQPKATATTGQSQPVRYVQKRTQQVVYPQQRAPYPQGNTRSMDTQQMIMPARRPRDRWLTLLVDGQRGALLAGFVLTAVLFGVIPMIFLALRRILPLAVSMLGVRCGGMTSAEAAQAAPSAQITLRDGDRNWQVNMSDLGHRT